jgi:hypothetical protein
LPATDRVVEILQIVFVICRIGLAAMIEAVADRGERSRAGMGRVGGGGKILEPVVVRDVVIHSFADHRGKRAAGAAGGAVGIGELEIEAAHEAAPGDAGVVEQIADVLAFECRLIGRARADVVTRIDVVDQRETALTVIDVKVE